MADPVAWLSEAAVPDEDAAAPPEALLPAAPAEAPDGEPPVAPELLVPPVAVPPVLPLEVEPRPASSLLRPPQDPELRDPSRSVSAFALLVAKIAMAKQHRTTPPALSGRQYIFFPRILVDFIRNISAIFSSAGDNSMA
jgi:hypothetical protein